MWATLVLVLVAFGFWLIYRFYDVIFILLIAIIMGTAIRPLVTWANRKGLHRVAGVLLFYLLMFVLLVGGISIYLVTRKRRLTPGHG